MEPFGFRLVASVVSDPRVEGCQMPLIGIVSGMILNADASESVSLQFPIAHTSECHVESRSGKSFLEESQLTYSLSGTGQ